MNGESTDKDSGNTPSRKAEDGQSAGKKERAFGEGLDLPEKTPAAEDRPESAPESNRDVPETPSERQPAEASGGERRREKEIPFGFGLIEQTPKEQKPEPDEAASPEPERRPESKSRHAPERDLPEKPAKPKREPVPFGQGLIEEAAKPTAEEEAPPEPEMAIEERVAEDPEAEDTGPSDMRQAEMPEEESVAVSEEREPSAPVPAEPEPAAEGRREEPEPSDEEILGYRIVEPPEEDEEDDFARIPPGPTEEVGYESRRSRRRPRRRPRRRAPQQQKQQKKKVSPTAPVEKKPGPKPVKPSSPPPEKKRRVPVAVIAALAALGAIILAWLLWNVLSS